MKCGAQKLVCDGKIALRCHLDDNHRGSHYDKNLPENLGSWTNEARVEVLPAAVENEGVFDGAP